MNTAWVVPLFLFVIFFVVCFSLLSAHSVSSKKRSEDETNTQDPRSKLDDDDQLSHGETVLGMVIPEGFRLQLSPPPALDQSLVERGVLVRLGLGSGGSSHVEVEHTRLLGVTMTTAPFSALMEARTS